MLWFSFSVEEKYIAKFNFEGKNGEYLSLREGDIVVVIHKDNNGWWTGSLNGKTGLFPGNYVKEIPPEVDFEKSKSIETNHVWCDVPGLSIIHRLVYFSCHAVLKFSQVFKVFIF